MVETIGYLGAAGAATMWMPQVARVIRFRHDRTALSGISPASYAIAVAFNALLLTYGATTDALPVVVAALANLICATVIVAVILRPAGRNQI